MTLAQQQTFDFDVAAEEVSNSDTQVRSNPAQDAEPLMLKRRVLATGERHGKAFGSIGVVTTSYTKGFSAGFISAFKD
jgi:hypothetical protein